MHFLSDKTRAKGKLTMLALASFLLAAATAIFSADSSLPGYPLVGPPCTLAHVEIIADFFDLLRL